jgi:mRNA interferase RelE/StbE
LGWSIEYSGLALKQLKKLNRSVQAEILDYMDRRIATAANPRDFGKTLRTTSSACGATGLGIIASFAN